MLVPVPYLSTRLKKIRPKDPDEPLIFLQDIFWKPSQHGGDGDWGGATPSRMSVFRVFNLSETYTR
jgi:hypothetical protein